jgi:CelD/BcsL family acetyltransferase involved in cellulose biosynthesis
MLLDGLALHGRQWVSAANLPCCLTLPSGTPEKALPRHLICQLKLMERRQAAEGANLKRLAQSEAGAVYAARTLAEVVSIETSWRSLDATSSAPLVWFQSYEWCRNWLECDAARTAAPRVLVLVSQGRLVAVWPMMTAKLALMLRTLRGLGEPHSQYANILTENGHLTDAEADLFCRSVRKLGGVAAMGFSCVPAASPLARVLDRLGALPAAANASTTLDLSQFGDASAYEDTVQGKARRNLKRSIRILEAQGLLSFDVLRPGMPNYREAVEACVAMKLAWLARTGRVGLGLQAGHARFLSALSCVNDGKDGPYAFVLSVAGRPAAIELGYLQRGHYYCYMGAFRQSLAQASPGTVQMQKSIAWLIDQGAQTFDLLANPSEYKRGYQSNTVPLLEYAIGFSVAGQLYSDLWLGRLMPAVKRSYGRLPQRLRTGVAIARRLEYQFNG